SLAPGSARHPLRPLFRWFYSSTLRRQCREACATAYVTAATLQQRYPPTAREFTTHYSGIDLPREQILPAAPEGFPDQGPYRVIMVASLAAMYKAHDVMLKALAETARAGCDVHSVFVGDGKHRAAMEQLAGNLGLGARVQFLGELPTGDSIRAQLDQAQ